MTPPTDVGDTPLICNPANVAGRPTVLIVSENVQLAAGPPTCETPMTVLVGGLSASKLPPKVRR